ncbi:hypothetical protein CK218_27665 [Mesorhizobium sp. WSM3879]|uniref:hypothetical protein n=1 Tax=Mesorhizobium sp. WSM3879 TaxID=2029406 RepID=UPI000BAECB22|nr:hypothetical protein [Mesorhizobium sp. WSM3879]PBB77884.1 hypothetical protein CK218_27665 [Mesorhizobium sp. WSM3879]
MKFRLLTALAVLAAGGLAAWRIPLGSLFVAFQPATVALSIMAAAVLVRLNRGMPTLDWKTLEPAGRKRLTSKIVDLQKDYLSLLAINALLVAILIALVIETLPATANWEHWLQRSISGVLSGGMVLVVVRMGHVVWRDYDIVRLQKVLIDAAADKEALESAGREAQKSVADMRQAMREAPKPTTGEWES